MHTLLKLRDILISEIAGTPEGLVISDSSNIEDSKKNCRGVETDINFFKEPINMKQTTYFILQRPHGNGGSIKLLLCPSLIQIWMYVVYYEHDLFTYVVFYMCWSWKQKRNFVIKCEGDSLVWNYCILRNLKRKRWGDMACYNPTVWKSGGTRPPSLPPRGESRRGHWGYRPPYNVRK